MKSLVLLLAVVLVAGCGSGKFSSPSGSITATQAASFASLTGATSPASSIKFNTNSSPNDLPTQGLSREGTAAECTTQDPESITDDDHDGIPLTKKTTWSCTDVTSGDRGTFTRNGTMTITDKDDTKAYAGYKYEYDVTGNGTDDRSTNFNYDYKGYFELTYSARNAGALAEKVSGASRASSWSYKTDWEGTYAYSYSGGLHSGTYGHTFEYTISENAARDEESTGNGTGTATIKGYYAYAGTGDSRSEGSYNVVFRLESEGLEWQRSGCNNFYKAGSIKWTDGAGNIMTWVYDSCTQLRVLFNGSLVKEFR